jgi:hypothetical protein
VPAAGAAQAPKESYRRVLTTYEGERVARWHVHELMIVDKVEE